MRNFAFLLIGLAALPQVALAAGSGAVLHHFTGKSGGSGPWQSLYRDAAGNIYGITQGGGQYQQGLVFELTPPTAGARVWASTLLHSFGGKRLGDGSDPYGGLVADPAGNFYGTTHNGGIYNHGTVYELSPPQAGQTSWTETVLYSFTGKEDGGGMYSGVIIDASGTLYGTTDYGGAHASGVVFKLSRPVAGQAVWTESVLYSFQGRIAGSTDGLNADGGLVEDSAGRLYGTCAFGGTYGSGTVFELLPPAAGQTAWTETILHNFDNTPTDGALPEEALILDSLGVLYGTTYAGGRQDAGVVFQLSPPAAGQTEWTETLLHVFRGGGVDGAGPQGRLLEDASGALYGTTTYGGLSNFGIVFKLNLPSSGLAPYSEHVLHSFSNGRDGSYPYGGLIADPAGTLYGTAGGGGGGPNDCCGTVFALTP